MLKTYNILHKYLKSLGYNAALIAAVPKPTFGRKKKSCLTSKGTVPQDF
jgi:hypothetical protein